MTKVAIGSFAKTTGIKWAGDASEVTRSWKHINDYIGSWVLSAVKLSLLRRAETIETETKVVINFLSGHFQLT